MKILIAEDDSVSRKWLSRTLGRLGYEVTATTDGEEAFLAFLSETPPLVISDWTMPKLDGVALCQRIRKLDLEHYTFFILLSAKDNRADYLEAMKADVDDFLQKPLDPEELGIRVRVGERIIQQRQEAERKIRLLARFPSENPNPVLQVDKEFRIRYANAASVALLTEWNCQVGGPTPEKLRRLADLLFRSGERQEIEISGSERVYSFSATSASPDGVTYLYGHDITDRKRAENELVLLKNEAEENALHDQLTGLPNRRLLTDRLKQETARALRQGHKLALVMADIDYFKQINDGYGHQIGDEVIVTVSHCLLDELRSSDTVCRWGGDELVLLLTDLRERGDLVNICTKLMKAVKKRITETGISAPVSLSMGSAILPDDTSDPVLLIQQADHALYVAKAEGRDRWREFSGFPEKHDAKGQADLFLRLAAAVAEQRITAFYQPIVDAASGRVVAAEALARWHDEHYGWVAPDVFIPLAEEKGLITKLGLQVLTHGLEQLSQWRRAGYAVTLAINISKLQVFDMEFGRTLVEEVKGRDLQPGWITLEITERESVLTHTLARERLKELGAAGFRLSVDDFGTGYSSFELVGAMPFDELKIDMALVKRMTDPKGCRIVQAIVEMAKTLGLGVVAEGVETEVASTLLEEMGAQKLQGYYFSKPLHAGELRSYLDSEAERTDASRRVA